MNELSDELDMTEEDFVVARELDSAGDVVIGMVDELGAAVVFVNDVDKVRFDNTSMKMSKSSLCLIPERDAKEK